MFAILHNFSFIPTFLVNKDTNKLIETKDGVSLQGNFVQGLRSFLLLTLWIWSLGKKRNRLISIVSKPIKVVVVVVLIIVVVVVFVKKKGK